MDIGVPRRVIVVEPEPIDAPTPVAPMPDPEPVPAGPVRRERPELVPARKPA
jgi:hypothetical protein